MPLNIRVENPSDFSGAILPTVPSLDSVIAALPGLIGAWDATDWSGSGAWLPRIGSGGQILPAVAGVAPIKATREGRTVMRFGLTSKAFVNNSAGGGIILADLTYAARAYFANTTANFQKIFDLGAPEFYYRSTLTPKVWQFAGAGAGVNVPIADPLAGWHRTLFEKSGVGAAMLSADGAASTPISAAGTALTPAGLVIGDAANATGAEQDISRIVLCSAGGLTADQRMAVNIWLAS